MGAREEERQQRQDGRSIHVAAPDCAHQAITDKSAAMEKAQRLSLQQGAVPDGHYLRSNQPFSFVCGMGQPQQTKLLFLKIDFRK
jgi:hypothetical protein